MKIKLRNKNFCDGCDKAKKLNTLGQHVKCAIYNKNMTPQDDVFLGSKGLGYFPRPKNCKDENEVVIYK